MTQRIFDIENEKDMQDLWDILPDNVCKIEAGCGDVVLVYGNAFRFSIDDIFSINFHDKTEITRTIQECTEQDIGKLCYFWGNDENDYAYGILGSIGTENGEKYYNIDNIDEGSYFEHARRLTKQEIRELI